MGSHQKTKFKLRITFCSMMLFMISVNLSQDILVVRKLLTWWKKEKSTDFYTVTIDHKMIIRLRLMSTPNKAWLFVVNPSLKLPEHLQWKDLIVWQSLIFCNHVNYLLKVPCILFILNLKFRQDQTGSILSMKVINSKDR